MNEGSYQSKKNVYRVLGLMSGTSLDGLDMAMCKFEKKGPGWKYTIEKAQTVPYTGKLKADLSQAFSMDPGKLNQLDHEYGIFIGETILSFISDGKKPDIVSSHGHTVFHDPGKKYTLQIGNGTEILKTTGLTVINDFRSTDVALGGQGAPLVPIGDRDLFPEYEACLNLGGFSNISFEKGTQRLAFDICPVNILLNYYAKKLGLDYDVDGMEGRKGESNPDLLSALNSVEYYKSQGPGSLSFEYIEREYLPRIKNYKIPLGNILRSLYEHIALQISSCINQNHFQKVLVTGGGSYNLYLMDLLKNKIRAELVIPAKELIDFKEALIFAYLGLLRYRGENNCLASVTGAEKDNMGGTIYWP